MRQIPAGLAAHLAGGTTTLARCWRITRPDGVQLGFTDHDRALLFDAVSHEPAAGFVASEMPTSLGLSVDTSEVMGALVSPTLTESDLLAGLYDGARIELWLVNWTTPSERLLLEVGVIGEITRIGAAFKAEMRSLAHLLDQEQGRVYAATCDADLGDQRCGIDLSQPQFHAAGTVASLIGPRTIRIAGAAAIAAGFLERGTLAWTSGANAGRMSEIRDDRTDIGGRVLDLWERPPAAIGVGDGVAVTVGCDKRFSTCVGRFGNAVNFRGFPSLPGTDFVISYAIEGNNNDGGKLV